MATSPAPATHVERAIAILLAAVFFVLYGHFGLRLAQGVYVDYLNLAFDFDPPYFMHYLVGKASTHINYKHPLSLVFRPFASLFLALGFAPKEAATLVMALFGALSVGLVYRFCRLADFGRPEAVGASVFFGAGSTALFTSIIAESYGWANFSIVLVWCLFAASLRSPPAKSKSRLFAAVLAAGVTITNLMQPVVAEFFIWVRTLGIRRSLMRIAIFGLVSCLLLLALLVILQPEGVWTVVRQPVQTAKQIYWLQTKGFTTGFSDLLVAYFGYAFFSPAFTKVALSPDVFMLDFREFAFTHTQTVMVLVWWLFGLAGLLFGLRSPGFRRIAIPLILVVVLNLLFHSRYQFRGSVYIYSAHLYFPIFVLGMGAAPWVSVQKWRVRGMYLGILLALGAAALATNLDRVSEFVVQFDRLTFPANAPEIAPESQ